MNDENIDTGKSKIGLISRYVSIISLSLLCLIIIVLMLGILSPYSSDPIYMALMCATLLFFIISIIVNTLSFKVQKSQTPKVNIYFVVLSIILFLLWAIIVATYAFE